MDHHICSSTHAWALDNPFRKLIHNPRKILRPFVKEGMTVLDVGCASGFFTRALAELVKDGNVIAADLQDGMLQKLKRSVAGTSHEKSIVLHKTKETSLDLTTKVDFILVFYVLHELKDKERFFKETKALLRGKMLIVEPKGHVTAEEFDRYRKLARKFFKVQPGPKIAFSRSMVLS